MRYISKSLLSVLLVFPLIVFAQTPVNVNEADVYEIMDGLTGVTEQTAQSIVEHRETNGSFKTLESLVDVEGVEYDFLNINRGYLHLGSEDEPANVG